MPKVTLQFDLPDEREDFELAVNGSKLQAILSEFDNWLRGKIKYELKEEWQEVRDQLWELANDNQISLL